MSDPLGPIIIGAREIYDQVIRLTASVDRLHADLTGVQADRVEDETRRQREHADHEVRLRSLERGRWPLHTLAVLIALASLLIVVLPKVIH